VKAFLLAAGLGTRLRPLTQQTPKCMLRVGGQPLLELWLGKLHRAGVDEVLVNLHHRPEVVTAYLARRDGPPAVRTSFEPQLLGSAGTLLAHRDWVEGDELFLACYADNLTDFHLARLVDAHLAHGGPATIAVFQAHDPKAAGIVEVDNDGRVTAFTEKPQHPTSDLANAGMYVFSPSVLDYLQGPPPIDIGYHLLPKLVGKARAVKLDCYLRDVGTLESYRLAQQEWALRQGR